MSERLICRIEARSCVFILAAVPQQPFAEDWEFRCTKLFARISGSRMPGCYARDACLVLDVPLPTVGSLCLFLSNEQSF